MTTLKKLIGLPVILDGVNQGYVIRGVVTRDGRNLRGLVVRMGLSGARWLPREQILLTGKVSVIGTGKTRKLPKDADYRLFRVSSMDGTRLGIVSDCVIHDETLQVVALEVSMGPVDDMIRGRWLATSFHVRPCAASGTGHVLIPEEVTQDNGEDHIGHDGWFPLRPWHDAPGRMRHETHE
ncbi:MAG: hypothetical protein IKT57_05855 [Clostridia bacterium]|nr:hypothetical protein [Clostridia bacterium]